MGAGGDDVSPLAAAARAEDRVAIAELILLLRRRGHQDRRAQAAMEQVPRRLFVEAPLREHAYEDRPLPIECGQTISAPSMVALMTEALALGRDDRVLEIGTGSGYQAAVLAGLAREVYTIERYRSLLVLADERFAALRISNIVTRHGDGLDGWPEKAPFERIVVTAAAAKLPTRLVGQLRVGGFMIVPVGPEGAPQQLMKVVRTAEGVDTTKLADVRFVPLVAGIASRL